MAVFYQEQNGQMMPMSSLWEALALEEVPHAVISLVGAGGKTSTMYQLAEECRARGKRVIVTTSTHIACPKEYPVAVIQKAEQLSSIYGEKLPQVLVVAGERIEDKNKLTGMQISELGRLAEYCDVLLIEADGSRRLPFKICAEHEPVICDVTQGVIGCVGVSAVGQRWKDACFRWERMEGCLEQETIQPRQVAEILADRNVGMRKRAGDRAYRVILNQVDDEERLGIAQEIVGYLRSYTEGETLVVAASTYR